MDRLQKLIAAAGLGSRRSVEAWIREGRVSVNGQTAALGDSADPDRDTILVDGKPLPSIVRAVYLLLNKPAGYVTTVSDPHAERTVMDLVRSCPARVFPVGRLDRDTTGLLLFTNDGDLAFRLTHPRFGVEKVYHAWVKGRVSSKALAQLQKGVVLEDGPTGPARARIKEDPEHSTRGGNREREEGGRGDRTLVELAIHEGRKRQVRRMLEAVGHPVIRLERVRYGPLELGRLRPGEWRRLTPAERDALNRSVERR